MVNMKNHIIGLSGVAGAGKDLFCRLLIEELNRMNIPAKRFALADELKLDLRDFCISKYDIDPVSCPRELKSKIRDFLVFHGHMKRMMTNGRYWIEKLNKQILADSSEVKIITDIRYNVFPKDELFWLQNELNGVLVHISLIDNGLVLPPPNEHEKLNDPKLKAAANYVIEWNKVSGEQAYVDKYLTDTYIKNFIANV
jgi:hypothetical protein